MSVGLVIQGMIYYFDTEDLTIITGDVDSTVTVVRETDIPDVSGVNDVRPGISTGSTAATDISPTITRIRNTKPDVS